MRVPEGWRYIDIGSIATVKVAGDVKKEFYSQHPTNTHCYPVYSNTIINKGLYGYYDFIEYENDAVTIVGRGIGIGTAFPRYKTSGFGAVGRLLIVFPKESSFDIRYFSESINFLLKIFYESGAIPQLPGYTLEKYKVLLPPLAEQEKIAEILSTWDHAIEQIERLKANAKTHKQALMQQLLTGKKRFPEFEGEWEEYKTKQIFKSIVRRAEGGEYEIFSVTKDGIIPQKEYFKKEIASKNTDNYKVIEFGDFVMSGLNFWMGSVDVYLEEYSGMISPAYKVYTIKKGFDISYIKHFVRSFEFNRVLVGSSILGASIVRRNFDSVAFDNWKLKLPSLEEQQKIAAVLNRADREIELLAQKLDYLKTEKRALMQQLLTGKRRVKVDG